MALLESLKIIKYFLVVFGIGSGSSKIFMQASYNCTSVVEWNNAGVPSRDEVNGYSFSFATSLVT